MSSLNEYRNAILTRYNQVKEGHNAHTLLEPTPGKFKQLCGELLKEATVADREVFKKFFQVDGEEVLFKHVQGFDTDKFKPLTNFLKGKSELTNHASLDLLAIAVDLHSRPFIKFRTLQKNSMQEDGGSDTDDMPLHFQYAEHEAAGAGSTTFFDNESSEGQDKSDGETLVATPVPQKFFVTGYNGGKRFGAGKILIFLAVIIGCIAGGFTYKNLYIDSGGCMIWKENHYEKADCNDTGVVHLAGVNSIIPLDKETLLHLKKVKVSDTTTFFNPNGTARIWYGKSASKELEFFTYHGLHPETGQTLKKITGHMINKHVIKKE